MPSPGTDAPGEWACVGSTIGLLGLVRVATGLLGLIAGALRLGAGSISARAGGIIVPLGVLGTALGLPFLGMGIIPFLGHELRGFWVIAPACPASGSSIEALCACPQIACPAAPPQCGSMR